MKKLVNHYEEKMAKAKTKCGDQSEKTHLLDRLPMKRRIMLTRETQPGAGNFSQTIDVDLDLGDGEKKTLPNMPDYFIRSASEAISYTRRILAKGIKSITYRLGGGLRPKVGKDAYIYAPLLTGTFPDEVLLDNIDTLINRHSNFYRTLRTEFPSPSLFIIGDPFGVAPNLSDGAWGVRHQNGSLDPESTSRLLATIAVEYARAGVDAILNIGRIEG